MRDPIEWPTTDLLAHRVATTPTRTAVVDAATGETWTYRELDAAVDAVAATLADTGVAAGDRVATLLPTSTAFVGVVHAVWRLGASLVPLNVEESDGALADQTARVDPAAVVAAEAHHETARGLADAPLLTVGSAAAGPAAAAADGVGASEDADPTPSVAPLERGPDHEALVVFTSGTTGTAKGVRLTTGNLVASATASAFRLGVDHGDRWLIALPMYHMGGLAPVVRTTLYGATAVVGGPFDAERTADRLAAHDVTCVSLVPTMLTRLLDTGWTPAESLRFVLLGGAPTPPALVERCENRGVSVCPTYGMTETASQVATARPEEAYADPETVGAPLVVTDVTVLGDDGEPLPAGERGELVVDGPTVTTGYLDDDRTDAAFGEHGLHTGDLGVRRADGTLRVVGRVDDVLVTGGENVHPATVVDALEAHPDVAAAAVVGLDDPEWGDRVAALLVPAGDAVDWQPLEAWLRDRVASYAVPKTVAVRDSLPRTASGTVDRDAVRERLRASRDDGTDPDADSDA
jgi:O-succinylbenzoic acid--CoA ligase